MIVTQLGQLCLLMDEGVIGMSLLLLISIADSDWSLFLLALSFVFLSVISVDNMRGGDFHPTSFSTERD